MFRGKEIDFIVGVAEPASIIFMISFP